MCNIQTKILLSVSLAVFAAPNAVSHAATFTTIYKFPPKLTSGKQPNGRLTLGSDGNLYGVTVYGGTNNNGTIFKITPEGRRVTLYSFSAEGTGDGVDPNGGLVVDSPGNLYGTTREGGVGGFGTVFKVAPDGKETVLHSFGVNGNTDDGEMPNAGLISDEKGNLYGVTTDTEQHYGHGTIFQITPSGHYKILYYFETSHKKGFEPIGRLLLHKDGTLYGTTGSGGKYALGTVFKFTPDGVYQTLYDFGASKTDGSHPWSGLVQGRSGEFYGTTMFGGSNNLGTVYRLDPNGAEKVIFNFSIQTGAYPDTELIANSSGILYGTSGTGGSHSGGSVFKLTPSGKQAVLHNFKGSDGYGPSGALIFDPLGNLYGNTSGYGDPQVDYGTVFEITP